MKRVLVIGCPGSGKSCFSRRLCDRIGLPLYHLDSIYWTVEGTTIPKDAFRKRLSEILAEDCWVIDGNYGATMEMRMQACDTVFFLDYPTEVCLFGLAQRKGKPRSDMPFCFPDDDDAEFVKFVKNYNVESRPKVLFLLERYADRKIVVLKSREEADRYLETL